jgi:hypothetical protein
VWNWENSARTASFSNRNRPGSRISALQLINAHDIAFLVTAADDGTVRVWRDYASPETSPSLVTAFRALTDLHRDRSSGLILEWQQEHGYLVGFKILVCMGVYGCVWVYIYIYIYIYMCVFDGRECGWKDVLCGGLVR